MERQRHETEEKLEHIEQIFLAIAELVKPCSHMNAFEMALIIRS